MARKMVMISAMAVTLITAMAPATAMAHDRYQGGDENYQRQDEEGRWNRDAGDEHSRWDNRQDYNRQAYDRPDGRYSDRRRFREVRYQDGYRDGSQQGYYDRAGYDRVYYGRPTYRYRCEGSGTTGTIVGAIAGGLIGNGLAGRGDRTLGFLLGGGAGALAGRAIDKSNSHC